ncbi:hypothetical protein AM233_01490 [Bacillus sp. FJAT-22058]|nr:hypothetical protein AM233_01490 [Bacillus sp. FJAT-22058]
MFECLQDEHSIGEAWKKIWQLEEEKNRTENIVSILKNIILIEKWKYILRFYKKNLLCERNP